ncbi:MAG: AAA family ATPase [Phycisphaeraceae bacterium]|nr:AAA family ATPase [Phycisphaeraceae bacterium]MCW5763030.1 AAA family ATPase [Phycisphaeraceae bacterium]
MHLSSVEIKNFRSLKDIRVDFQPGLNVLVGRNNTGKTNLIQAIRHALGPSASRGDALWLDRDDFFRGSATAEPESTMSVSLTFSGLTENQRTHFYEIVDFDVANLDSSKALIRFEASWPKGKRQATIKRTGGPSVAEPPEVPTALLESLPITFLPALRNAEECLAPGYRSRLALLLREMADRAGKNTEAEIMAIYTAANTALEAHALVSGTTSSLQTTTQKIAGTDHVGSTINAAAAEFEKILRTLQVQMKGAPIGSLSANGLGLNNLLYIAVVLEHLKQDIPNECPLLLVEEPEAHLHPQLTMLLAEYLSNTTPGAKAPQTLVTTHSPTLAASVPPNRIHVVFTDHQAKKPCCHSVAAAGMDEPSQAELQRMMDITRATLYFAKGVILVEGISESLLIPVLARRLGHDLSKEHVSVIPICGVAFETFKKLLDPAVLGIPAAIVSDADPTVARGASWDTDTPQAEGTGFKLCDRMNKLIGLFNGHATVRVFHSKLTLEYDLADAGDENAAVMAAAWESCFVGTPGTFNAAKVAGAGPNRADKALAAWRGICRADHSGSKAEFAHRLSAKLGAKDANGQPTDAFAVPEYLKLAIEYVVTALRSPAATVGAVAQ